MGTSHSKSAAQMLVELINVTGGVIEEANGTFSPCGDEDWTDLGDAYYAACAELGVKPLVTKRGEE
jgi:hypothetical protein